MFSAAKAVLQDLNSHQILPILLTGEPLAKEERQRQHAMHAVDERREPIPAWARARRVPAAAQPAAAAGSPSSQGPAPPSHGSVSGTTEPALGANHTKGGDGAGGGWFQEQRAAEEGRASAPAERLQEGAAGQGQQAGAGGWLRRLSEPLWGVPAALIPDLKLGIGGAPVRFSLTGAAGAAGSALHRWTQPLLGTLAGELPVPVVFEAYGDAVQRLERNGGLTADPTVQHNGVSEAGHGAEPTAGAPGPGGSSSGDQSSGSTTSSKSGEALGCEGFQRVLQQRGLDCRGWNLVVTGEGWTPLRSG